MRNLYLTEDPKFNVVGNYGRMVKKNKELINILIEDKENMYESGTFLKDIESNPQIIGIVINSKALVMPKSKLLIVKTKVTNKELDNVELIKGKLQKPLSEHMKNVIEVSDTFNRLDILLGIQKELSEYNVRFIGKNLFRIGDLKIGYLSDNEITKTETKKKVTLNSDLTYAVRVKEKELTTITKEEYDNLILEENDKRKKPHKAKPKKSSKTSSKRSKKGTTSKGNKTSSSKPKTSRSLKDIFNVR